MLKKAKDICAANSAETSQGQEKSSLQFESDGQKRESDRPIREDVTC